LDGEAESTGSVGVLMAEGDSAKQDWSCPREGTEAGHIIGCVVCAGTMQQLQRHTRCSGSQ
jgi:hypothetical protein